MGGGGHVLQGDTSNSAAPQTPPCATLISMGPAASIRRFVVAGTLALALGSCGGDDGGNVSADDRETSSQSESPTSDEPLVLWPAPDDPKALARKAGVRFEVIEHLKHHVHAHLDFFLDGQPVQVPPGIGIAIADPAVREFSGPLGPGYGGIEPPGCKQPCISELHTHDPDGVLHTESVTAEVHTLGQFFIEWDVALTEECVADYCTPDTEIAFYVDGELFEGDPATIELVDHREIAIVIGTPPDEIPASFDFRGV
jgi:hypothetical protein